MSASTEQDAHSQKSSEVADSFLEDDNVHVALTHSPLDTLGVLNRVKSPKAGAVVLFAGTTRDSFDSKPVKQLTYTSYPPLALRSLLAIAKDCKHKHSLTAISMVHRLGTVPIGEESILIAVSAPHRQAAWRAGEEALEECKAKVEVWKLEEFEDGGIWRANRDGLKGSKVSHPGSNGSDDRKELEGG